MDLTKLFEMQKALDARIVKGKGLEGQDLLPEKILSLQVELGELANEWRGFKFWSEDREPRTALTEIPSYAGIPFISDARTRNPLLEEYVDCLHFILSIGLTVGITNPKVEFPKAGGISKEFIIVRFNECIRYTNMLLDDDYYDLTFQYFMDLGYMLGFTWPEIEQAYYDKNKVNHERQEQGY